MYGLRNAVRRLLEKLLAVVSRLTLRRKSIFFAVCAGGGLAAVLTLAILGGDRSGRPFGNVRS